MGDRTDLRHRPRRDDKNYHVDHEARTQMGYKVGSNVEMGFSIAGMKTMFENGAALAISGSHL